MSVIPESYLYLVEIIGVGVKVGVSTQPTRRVAAHHRDASAYGRKVGRTWISDHPHSNALENEKAIKQGARREYLGRSFDDCLAHAQRLPMPRAEQVSAADTPTNQFLSALFPAFGEYLAGGAR